MEIGILIDFIIHIDKHLATIVQQYGSWTYGILFLVVFCETGLIITPLLPGDSLLFAAGAIASRGNLNPEILCALLIAAAFIGDAVNYGVGHFLGPKILQNRNSKIFKKEYLDKTQHYYDRYGGKTIIIARFIPIVRTFAPFLAGVGSMSYPRFALFNIVGAVGWVVLFVYAGYLFSEVSVVKNNFSLVILAIIIVSIMPALIEILRARRASSNA